MATSIEAPHHIDVDHQAGSYNEANTLSPMAQFSDAPGALWQSMPIAPPLPSAERIAPPDFAENFIQKCLHPSKTFLVAEGFEAKEEGPKEEEAPKTVEPEIKKQVIKVHVPKAPKEPQPDYFGHLLGHPLSAEDDDEDDHSEAEEQKDADVEGEANDTKAEANDTKAEANDANAEANGIDKGTVKDVEKTINEVRKDDSEKPKDEDVVVAKVVEAKKKPSIAASSPVKKVKKVDISAKTEPTKEASEPEESEDGDDDVDYFGHIMGHPMNRGSGSHKAKKQTSPAKKDESPVKVVPKAEIESQESQGSVLGLFLAGIEVCDREENIGQFTSRGGDAVDTTDIEAEVVEEIEAEDDDESNEPAVLAQEESETPAVTPANAPDTPAAEEAQESEAVPVAEKVTVRAELPIDSRHTPEKRSNEAGGAGSTNESGKKSRSFLASLCGGKSND